MTQICENEACRHENEVGTRFCVNCGQPFTTNTAPTPECEHDNNGSGTFCIKCGEQYIKEPITASEPEAVPIVTPEATLELAQAPAKPKPEAISEATPSTPEQVEVPPSVVKAECKHDNGGSGTFCIKCGEKFIHGEAAASNVKAASKQSKPKSASSTKTKIALIVAAAVIVFAAAGYWILGKTLSNKSELTSGLQKVIVSNDADKFFDMLTFDEEDIFDVEKDIYKEYLKENEVGELAAAVLASINELSNSDQLVAKAGNTEVDEFKIIKNKKFGIFESYEIQPIEFDVYVDTNSNNIVLTIAEQEFGISIDDEKPVTKLLPGTYTYTLYWYLGFESIIENKYYEDYEYTVTPYESYPLDGSIPMYEVPLNDDFQYLIYDEKFDYEGFIRDGNLYVPEGVEIELTATFKEDGVEYKSEPVRITDTAYPDFYFPKYEEKLEKEKAKEEAKQETEIQIGSLIYDYLWIYSNGDVNSLHTVIATDSEFYKTQTKYLQGLNDKNTQANADEFKIEKVVENSNGTYTVTVNEWYTIYKPDASPKDVKQKSIYTVKRIDGRYYITGLKLG